MHMLPGYHYHIFVSYRNSGPVPIWLHNHFLPVLRDHLEGLLPEEPRIFVDREEIETGSQWPERLVNALQRSCCLLAVWNPPYFRFRWCMAEWQSMVAREKLLQEAGRSDIPCLIYPIVFADGEHFPEAAKKTQIRKDPIRSYGESRLDKASAKLGQPKDAVCKLYENLNNALGGRLNLQWKDQDADGKANQGDSSA